jgi:hypothetical protein
MRTERELLVDCLQRLNRMGAPYMLVGSMASNYWGIPRSTHDIYFVVVLGPADVSPLAAAFGEGFFIQTDSIRSAFSAPYQFNAIDEQSALKVDFWMLRDDAFEQYAFGRRIATLLFDTPAWLTTAEDVILHKLYWNKLTPSDRQLTDAAGVYAVQATALDQNYLRHWAATLGVDEQLDALASGALKPKSS